MWGQRQGARSTKVKIKIEDEEEEETEAEALEKKEDIEKLFGDTAAVHEIQNSANKGTGLGLTLCKELMEKMGGTIEVESEFEKGSVFRLVFPKAA